MILKSLTLHNIKSYRDESIQFHGGTTLFEGDMGSGKSSILMAIEFALFGLGDQKGASLLRRTTDEGYATLEFEVDGENYEVYRSLKRKRTNVGQGTDGYLKDKNGKYLLSPTELKGKILDILHFEELENPRAQSVIYRYAVYTPQEEMKAILFRSVDKRLETLRKAFGIEDYKIATSNASIFAGEIKGKMNVLEGQIKDLEEKKAELKKNETLIDENKTALEKLGKEKEKIENEKAGKNAKLKELKDKEKKLGEVKGEIPHIQTRIEDKVKAIPKLEKECEKLSDEIDSTVLKINEFKKTKKPTSRNKDEIKKQIHEIRGIEEKRKTLAGNIPLLKEDMGRLEGNVGDYKNKDISEVKKEFSRLKEETTRVGKEIDSKKEERDKLKGRITVIGASIKDLDKKLKNIGGLGEKCPICEKELTEEHKKNLEKERQEKIDKLEKEKSAAQEEEGKLSGPLRKLEQQKEEKNRTLIDIEKTIIPNMDELAKKRGLFQQNLEDTKKLKATLVIKEEKNFPRLNEFESPSLYLDALLDELIKYNSSQEKISTLREKLEGNRQKISENKREIETSKETMKGLKGKLEEALKKLERLTKVEEEIKKLEGKIDGLGNNLKEVSEKIASIKADNSRIEKYAKGFREEIKKKEEQKKLRAKLSEYKNWLEDYFIKTLENIEKHVMYTLNQDFNQQFQKWFILLIDDPSKDARVDEYFSPIIEQDGYEQEVDFLSGGEKTSIALGYRLALNSVVHKVSTGMKSNLLILDEPTDGFSKEQLFKVREILNELKCPQVIVVSHENELESFADQIFRVEKHHGVSKVVNSGG